ncbi:MAG: hypothetical protein JXB23_06530, partial [Candidatus Aminicenantes bacterium]|nr:hypothetical protein [Candidatus Aminicenantes bacterium]
TNHHATQTNDDSHWPAFCEYAAHTSRDAQCQLRLSSNATRTRYDANSLSIQHHEVRTDSGSPKSYSAP